MPVLFDKTIDLLVNMLDVRAAKHKVIVSNIANLDTPDYKPQEVQFRESLERATAESSNPALARTHEKHFSSAPGNAAHMQVRPGGDKVDIDREMANLAENNMMYNMTAELLSRKFKGLDTLLKETK